MYISDTIYLKNSIGYISEVVLGLQNDWVESIKSSYTASQCSSHSFPYYKHYAFICNICFNLLTNIYILVLIKVHNLHVGSHL